jgi:hypothetical protein
MSASIIAFTSSPFDARRPFVISDLSSFTARGERVERAANLVKVADPRCIERRDEEAAAGGVLHEAVLLQKAQRLKHRRARYLQLLGDLLLRDAGSGRERPFADGVEQHLVNLVDVIRARPQLEQFAGHDECSFWIQNT